MKYGLRLEGYPRDDICDPSNLSTSELVTLRESLVKGTCGFKPLLAADKALLQTMVDEQERRGENPWGKRKRRNDAGKPRKKQKNMEPTMRLGSTPPSCSPFDHRVNETNSTLQSDSDGEETRDDDTDPEIDAGQPRKMIGKRALNAANQVRRNMATSSRSLTSMKVAQCSSSVSATATASSSAHVVAYPVPTARTLDAGTNATSRRTQYREVAHLTPEAQPAHRLVDCKGDSESGEEELDDPRIHLAKCLNAWGGSPEYQAWS